MNLLSSTKHGRVPAFTICPQYEGGYKKKLLKDKYGLTPTDVRKFKYPKDLTNSRMFFEEITYNISEFIKSLQVVTSIQNFKLDATNSYRYETFFKETNWLSFGRCFTLELPNNQTVFFFIIESFMYDETNVFPQVQKLQIVTKIGNYVYVHHKGQFFHLNRPPKIQTDPGEKLFVNMNHELLYSLESLKHQEDGQVCLNTNNFALDDCVIKVWKMQYKSV